MTIGTTTSTCLRTLNRTRLLARNEPRPDASCRARSRSALPRSTRREIHVTRRAGASTQSSFEGGKTNATIAGNENALEQYRRSTTSLRLSATRQQCARGLADLDESRDHLAAESHPNLEHKDAEPQDGTQSSSVIDDTKETSIASSPDSATISYVTPRQSQKDIFRRLVQDGKIKLDTAYRHGPVTSCIMTLHIPGSQGPVEVVAADIRPGKAKSQAQALLMSKLQETGAWGTLKKMASLHPVLDVDDDLLFMMRWATHELVQAGDTVRNHIQPLTKPRPRENRLPIASHNTKQLSQEMYARLKTIRKLRNSRELAGTPILPVAHHKQQLLGLIKDHTYSIIVAETGSGKSTQVPQIIVDDAIENHAGLDCRVMCVQPRRIAAQSLAYRVADERAEPVGRSVGYNVRFDRKSPVFEGGGTITYCTTGIFLNLLQDSSARLQSLSHIILDEVHVRDVGIDLVMLLLKRYVEKRQATGAPVPKIIVMSATVDVDLFSSYFRNKALDGTLIPAPHLTIAGRSFEVKKHYLEELLTTLEEFYSNKDLRMFFEQDMTRDYLANHAKQFGGDGSNESETQDTLAKKTETWGSSASLADLDPYDEDRLMPYGLICATLFYLLSKTKDGSLLVFLPGLNHIFALEQDLHTYGELIGIDLSNEARYRVVKLHSSLQEEQQKLSLEVPDGCRRIILSTDIAEASLTIPDVRYVIDAGKVNEMIFDSKASSHRMACCWVSRSSALQRAGRAGRVQPGEYFFLGTKQRFDTLRITKSPEIVRSDLRETCLRTRKASPEESLSAILQRAIEPPEDTKVRIATESLKRLKALDQHENITSLGSILCQLSINPALGKLIILGVIFRCLDPLLILGSMSDGTSLFRRALSVEDRQVIAESVRAFAGESSSDQIGYINAFKAVRDVWHGESPRMAWQYAIQHNIYFPSYRQMSIAARHMLHILARAKLIKRWQATKIDYQHRFGGAELNTNSHHVPLIKALLLHCLFPQIAIPVVQSRYYTQTDPAVLMGMTSVNNPKVSKSSLTLFNRKQSFPDNLPMLFDTSNITPLMACLFGGNLERNDKFLASGSWLKVGINSRKVELGGEGDDAITNVIELYNAIADALEAAFESLASGRNSFPSYGEKVALYHSRNALFATLHRTLRDVLDRDLNRIPTISAHADKWDDYASVLQNSSS